MICVLQFTDRRPVCDDVASCVWLAGVPDLLSLADGVGARGRGLSLSGRVDLLINVVARFHRSRTRWRAPEISRTLAIVALL